MGTAHRSRSRRGNPWLPWRGARRSDCVLGGREIARSGRAREPSALWVPFFGHWMSLRAPYCNLLERETRSGGHSPIDIGRPSRAFPVTPPCVRVRTRRFGWLGVRPNHQRFGRRRAFGHSLRHGQFGPFAAGRRGYTPTLRPKGQPIGWVFCRLLPMSRASYSPLHLLPGGGAPFGPSAWRSRPCDLWLFLPFRASVPVERADGPRLLCPLLTSAPRSRCLAAPPVPVPRHDADLPR